MSLLTQPTAEEQTLQQIHSTLRGGYAVLRSSFDSIVSFVWQNPYGLTPAQVFALLGINGGELFQYSNDIIPVLNTAAAKVGDAQITTVVPEGVTVNISNDGTVTLT